jgi:precorrin-2 dehydrogenase/sirohydrochlorin ferrochelatase
MFMRLTGRESLVGGGGGVGTRKVESLLAAGSRVTVVSREATDELKLLIAGGNVAYIKGEFLAEHLDDKFICVSALDDRALNETVARCCRERGVLVNVVDDPGLSDFFFPSVVTRGDLVIAISSGGVSPTEVKKIRRELEVRYGPEYETVIAIMGGLRNRLRDSGVTGARLSEVMERAASLPLAEMIREGRTGEIQALVDKILIEEGVPSESGPVDPAGFK